MSSYIANLFIKNPSVGVNRDTVTVPPGFHLHSIIAFVPVNSVIDIKDNNRSIFGKMPIGGGIFNTHTRKLDFPIPVKIQTTEVDIYIELYTPSTDPIQITLLGVVNKEAG